MSKVVYVSLPGGGYIASSTHRPDVFLTWQDPSNNPDVHFNVHVHRHADAWLATRVGLRLDWHAFCVQSETLLGVDEHDVPAAPARPHAMTYAEGIGDQLPTARCSCGHWRCHDRRDLAEAKWSGHARFAIQ